MKLRLTESNTQSPVVLATSAPLYGLENGSIPFAGPKTLKRGTINPVDGRAHNALAVGSTPTPATTIARPVGHPANTRQDQPCREAETPLAFAA